MVQYHLSWTFIICSFSRGHGILREFSGMSHKHTTLSRILAIKHYCVEPLGVIHGVTISQDPNKSHQKWVTRVNFTPLSGGITTLLSKWFSRATTFPSNIHPSRPDHRALTCRAQNLPRQQDLSLQRRKQLFFLNQQRGYHRNQRKNNLRNLGFLGKQQSSNKNLNHTKKSNQKQKNKK